MLKFALLLLSVFAAPAFSHGFAQGETIVAHPHVFPAPKGAQSAAGYLTLMNNGTSPERLLAVRSSFAQATFHMTSEEDGIARMRPLDAIEIPGVAQTVLAPGGLHIMFLGLGETALEVGDRFTVTLVFERAGEVEVEFWVEARTKDGPAMDHAHHGHEE